MANEDLVNEAAALLRAGAAEDFPDYEDRRRKWLDRFYLSQNPQVWQVNVNGAGVKVEDLPLGVVDGIAKGTGTSWLVVVNQPLLDLAVAVDVYEAAAKHLGLDAPPDVSVRDLVDVFTLVPDTVPDLEPVPEEEGPLAPSSGPTSETPG